MYAARLERVQIEDKRESNGGKRGHLETTVNPSWEMVSNPQSTTGKSGTIEGNHMTARRFKKKEQQIESEREENEKNKPNEGEGAGRPENLCWTFKKYGLNIKTPE